MRHLLLISLMLLASGSWATDAASAHLASLRAAQPLAASECEARTSIEYKACLAELAPQAERDRHNAETAARAAMKRLDDVQGRKSALPAFERDAQAYARYRDAHCAWIDASFGSGSGAGSAELACRIDLERDRAHELSRYYMN
ncbi:lysozyme inhibitor LprI family protein [Chitinibacteraceae bacterium HSL-7]